jgi:hypothetical protein
MCWVERDDQCKKIEDVVIDENMERGDDANVSK